MPTYVKTAKDKAWDAERTKLKSEKMKWVLRCQERDKIIAELREENECLAETIKDLEAAITELTKGDMTPDEAIKKMRKQAELADTLGFLVKGVPGW